MCSGDILVYADLRVGIQAIKSTETRNFYIGILTDTLFDAKVGCAFIIPLLFRYFMLDLHFKIDFFKNILVCLMLNVWLY